MLAGDDCHDHEDGDAGGCGDTSHRGGHYAGDEVVVIRC